MIRTTRGKAISLLCMATVVLGAFFAGQSPAQSAPADKTFAVDDSSDNSDSNLLDGLCESNEGKCTLRAAIQQANALYLSATVGSSYTITLPSTTYFLAFTGADEDNGATGDLDIRCNLTILGNPLAPPTIDASNIDDRVFDIIPPTAPTLTVRFSNVNIVNGHTTTTGGGLRIFSFGLVTLDHVSIMSNTISGIGTRAGGIDHQGTGTLVLNNSTVRANSVISGSIGGGIFSQGLLILNSSSVVSNTVRSDNDSTKGGGISVSGGSGVVLNNSQILSNTIVAKAAVATTLGGGLSVTNAPVTMTNSIIRANVAQGTTASLASGGGIYLGNGSLRLLNGTISSNKATGIGGINATGGGIYAGNSTLRIEQLSMTDNTSKQGGGIDMFNSSATISNSTICSNTALSGGGIQLLGNLDLYGSTFNNNIANGSDGGAIRNDGTLTVTNSTFTFNTAITNGGAIANTFSSSKLNLASDTFYFNFADSGSSGGGTGGGVFNNAIGGGVSLRNTLFSFNFRGGLASDCAGTLQSAGYNLVQSQSGCVIQFANGEVTNQDPMLGTLHDNGGPTKTQALPAGSVAINRGDPAGCKNADGSPLLVDQRGFPRIGRCDIGAYEYLLRVFLPSIRR